jgi:hypothetical protein
MDIALLVALLSAAVTSVAALVVRSAAPQTAPAPVAVRVDDN